MAKHTKLLSLISVLLVAIVLTGLWLALPSSKPVVASGEYIGLNIGAKQHYDIASNHAPGYYYLSAWIGEGTWESPFIPAISKLTDIWSSIDLREDCTRREGFCLTFSPDLVYDTTLSQITNTLIDDIEDVKWQSIKTVLKANDIKEKKLPNFIHELLKGKIKPGADGKTRIYLGGLIYGEPLPDYTHQTITDNFARGASSSLGTSGEGWTWTDISGSFGINGSQQAIQDQGYGAVSMSRANSDLGSQNMYAQITTESNGDVLGIACRKQNNTTQTYYCSAYVTSNQLKAYKVVTGTPSALDSTQTVTYGAGYVLKLQTDGSTITTWYNGTQEHNFSDTSIDETTNPGCTYAGLFAYANAVIMDNFEADALSAAAPSIALSSSSRAFGTLYHSQTYWSYNTTLGYSPSWPLGSGECIAYIENDGTATGAVSANASGFLGGTTLTLTDASPGATSVRMSLFKEGDGSTDNITLSGSPRAFIDSIAASATVYFDIKLEWCSGYENDAVQKTSTIQFTISAL